MSGQLCATVLILIFVLCDYSEVINNPTSTIATIVGGVLAALIGVILGLVTVIAVRRRARKLRFVDPRSRSMRDTCISEQETGVDVVCV